MGVSGAAAIAVEWAAFAVSFPFVGLRMFVRYQAGRLGSSDLIVLFTWLMFLAKTTCDNELWRRGLYRENLAWKDDWSAVVPDPDARVAVMKIGYASYFPYLLQLWGVKFSLIALYYNYITIRSPRLQMALHCVSGYVAVTLVVSLALQLLRCVPISQNWAIEEDDRQKCMDRTVPYLIPVIFHISSDFALCVIPFLFLKSFRLRLPHRQHACIVALFTLGGASIAVSIGRFVARGSDANITTLAVWTAIEMKMGMVLICLAAVAAVNSNRKRRSGSIPLPPGNNDTSDSGKEEETVKSWFSVRSRSASKTSDNMFRGSTDNLDLELESPIQKTQPPPPSHRRSSRISHTSRFLSRISQSSREGLNNVVQTPGSSYDSMSPLSSTPPTVNLGRKLSQDRAYPQSEFRVEESLRQNNGNVQESVNALRDDILRSISFAYDEQSYNHDHHTHAQPRKLSKDANWR
ncbi:hypothetical protein TWF696_004596 [Orbilia brochopaga]|uniref:Rhodopsin domain-containing protein n=1 Tax=Orbilia brochopaga TaxID=3140254 RepID=A0AAV9V7D4_9PEZI